MLTSLKIKTEPLDETGGVGLFILCSTVLLATLFDFEFGWVPPSVVCLCWIKEDDARGGGVSIVKVPGDVPPTRVYFSEPLKSSQGYNFWQF